MKDYDDGCSEFRLDIPEEYNFGFHLLIYAQRTSWLFENHARGYRWIFP
jgi:hypothetical protein